MPHVSCPPRRTAALLLAAGFAAGCIKPVVPLGQTVVEDVIFEGNGWGPFARDGERLLGDAIDTRASRRWIDLPGAWEVGGYVGDLAFVDPATMEADAERLVVWYQHHGWFDARFVRWEQRPRRVRRPGDPPRVDLVAHIDRGEPTRLDADPELVIDRKLDRPMLASLQKLVELGAGDVFDLEAYTESLDALQARLQERGYAYAQVSGEVSVRPDLHTAHVVYTVAPGRPCVFGEIRIVGEKGAMVDRLRRDLGFDTGDGFRTSKLLAARQRLYGLGVFRLVEVTPILKSPDERAVPIQVRLERRPSRQVGAGLTLEVETNRQEVSAGAEYQDDDALHRLYRWKVTGSAGVATTVEFTRDTPVGEQIADTVSPVASLGQSFTIPDFFLDTLELRLDGDLDFDVLPAYREFEAQAAPALTWRPDGRIALTAGYRLKYHRYFDFESLEDIERTRLSATIREEALVSMLEQGLVWDARDDKLAPTRNYYVSTRLGEAGGPFGGDLDFFRVEAEARGYKGVRIGGGEAQTVFAGRLGGGVVLAYGDEGVDVDETLKLGGGTTVRGWGEERLGPHLCYSESGTISLGDEGKMVCGGDDVTVEAVGGVVSAYGNAEVRQDLPWNFGAVLFVDVGRVWDSIDNVSVAGLQWSVGTGLRYRSPIGPIRLDVAWVPEPDPYFQDEPGWALNLGIGEAF